MFFQILRINSGSLVTIAFLINGVKSVLTNVAINKTVTASSTYIDKPGWNEWHNIVDGNIMRDGQTCSCCASTNQEDDPWITVDLKQQYRINNVVVYGRNHHNYAKRQNLVGLQIHLTDTSGIQGDGFRMIKGHGWIDFVNVTVEQHLQSRYVTLLLKGEARQLPICELEVYCTVCEPGYFGQDCNSMCGKCYNNAPCNTLTGACDQCMAGFRGVTCSTACENGTYGSNCRLTCGHCYGDQPCNKVDGTCVRCDLGYLGNLCETECISGTYGQDCSMLCGFCLKYESCNHATGLCSKGCAAGRQGYKCNQACGNNTFGVNCRQHCHCVHGISCDSINGECEYNQCAEGFFGMDCQQLNDGPAESDGNYQSMFIGVWSGAVCIIILLVVTGVCFLMRRKRDAKSPKTVTNQTDGHQYEDLEMYITPL